MHMLPFTKIHLVELAIEIYSTNQEITTAAVSSLRTGTSDTSDFTEYLSANWNLFPHMYLVVLFNDKNVPYSFAH